MTRRFNRIGTVILLIVVLLAAAWIAREKVVTCHQAPSYCVVQNRWTGNLSIREIGLP